MHRWMNISGECKSGYMVSSSLWLMDALLYILADFVDHYHRQRSVEILPEDEEHVADQSLSNS